MIITAIHHVNITVPARLEDAARNFYGRVLGLKEIPKPPTSRQSGAWYEIGEVQVHLSVDDEEAKLSSRHVCLIVSDLTRTAEELQAAQIDIIPDPRPVPNSPRFYVRDPGGNMLEITEKYT